MHSIKYYNSGNCVLARLKFNVCKLSQEKLWETSGGKAKFSRSLFCKVDWMWLHYQESNDCVICHTHAEVFKELKMHVESAADTFVSRGFQNFKLATTLFCQYELSAFHKEAVEADFPQQWTSV